MKTILLALLSATLLTISSTVSHAQTSADEAAIKRVIYDSQLAFNKRDLKTFSGYFIKSPALYYQVRTGDNQLLMARGWEAMTHMVGGHMKNDPKEFPANPTPIPATDVHVQVRGNMAWVDATTHWEAAGKKGHSRDLLILEKQAGNGSTPRWQIAALTTQTYADKQLVVIR